MDTHSSDLDDYIEGPSFLNSRQYPTISFNSTSVEKIDERTVQVTGNLTLLGVTQPVLFSVQVDKLGDGSMFGFSARGDIRRTDFGMTSGVPLVSEVVTIQVATEAVRGGVKGGDALQPFSCGALALESEAPALGYGFLIVAMIGLGWVMTNWRPSIQTAFSLY